MSRVVTNGPGAPASVIGGGSAKTRKLNAIKGKVTMRTRSSSQKDPPPEVNLPFSTEKMLTPAETTSARAKAVHKKNSPKRLSNSPSPPKMRHKLERVQRDPGNRPPLHGEREYFNEFYKLLIEN